MIVVYTYYLLVITYVKVIHIIMYFNLGCICIINFKKYLLNIRQGKY